MCRFQNLFISQETVVDIYSKFILIISHYNFRKALGLFNQTEWLYLSHIL